MHISYMKVAIYALTFLSYAYSGYGANIITSLRDSILAAEAIFGDVFNNLIAVARKFKVVHEVFNAAVEENCIFKCPNGGVPMRNKFYTPSSDGCGSLGMKINSEYLPAKEMETCCNEHDICYDTCNSDKELCDLDFKRCLYKYCDTYEKSTVGDIVVKGCKGASKMLFTGTLTLGCKAYLDSQARSCHCSGGSADSGSNTKSDYKNYNKKSKDSRDNSRGNNPKASPKDNKADTQGKYGWKDINDM